MKNEIEIKHFGTLSRKHTEYSLNTPALLKRKGVEINEGIDPKSIRGFARVGFLIDALLSLSAHPEVNNSFKNAKKVKGLTIEEIPNEKLKNSYVCSFDYTLFEILSIGRKEDLESKGYNVSYNEYEHLKAKLKKDFLNAMGRPLIAMTPEGNPRILIAPYEAKKKNLSEGFEVVFLIEKNFLENCFSEGKGRWSFFPLHLNTLIEMQSKTTQKQLSKYSIPKDEAETFYKLIGNKTQIRKTLEYINHKYTRTGISRLDLIDFALSLNPSWVDKKRASFKNKKNREETIKVFLFVSSLLKDLYTKQTQTNEIRENKIPLILSEPDKNIMALKIASVGYNKTPLFDGDGIQLDCPEEEQEKYHSILKKYLPLLFIEKEETEANSLFLSDFDQEDENE